MEQLRDAPPGGFGPPIRDPTAGYSAC